MGRPASRRNRCARASSLSSVFQSVLRKSHPLQPHRAASVTQTSPQRLVVHNERGALSNDTRVQSRQSWLCARSSLTMEWSSPVRPTPRLTPSSSASPACLLTGSTASIGPIATPTTRARSPARPSGRKLFAMPDSTCRPSAIEELNQWDARMWMDVNPAMLAWQLALKQRGLLTAIVSNMGDAVHEQMMREFNWLSRFDVLVWSYQLRMAKPDPAIYRYVLEKLGRCPPAETLFIDDRPVNVEAAVAMGMKGLVFSTVEKLRAELVQTGLDRELPLL